jgi:desulfoferrodoxin (superoxide reductase-like protein)
MVLMHHAAKNTTPPIPSKRDRQGTKTRGGSFFPSQKESNHRIAWIHLLEDEKETQQHDFEKNT